MDDARQSGANIAYTYDALKRLTTASTSAWNQSMTYNGFGNLTSKSVPSGSSEPVFPGAVSSKNWLAGVSYDANGNALAVNAFALTYDMENRLATATSGTAVESYFYDEANHRVEKTMGSNDYLYFYGPSGKLLSIRSVAANGVTSVVADRVYSGGMLLGSAGASGNWDVSTLTDRLGTAATGYPYGTDRGGSVGNDQPDFATYTKENTTGFEYANQRYYSAGMGRFLTVDPYGGNAHPGSPQSWNRYAYTQSDPINKNDPTGLVGINPFGPFGAGMPGDPWCALGEDFLYDGSCTFAIFDAGPTGGGQGGGSHGVQNQLFTYLTNAANLALSDLKKPDCVKLFEAPNGSPLISGSTGKPLNPSSVLAGLVSTAEGQPGSEYGTIVFGDTGSTETPAYTVGNGLAFNSSLQPYDESVTITINPENWTAGSFKGGFTVVNSETLLHELGHAIGKLSPGWGSSDQILDDSTSPSQSQANTDLITAKCVD